MERGLRPLEQLLRARVLGDERCRSASWSDSSHCVQVCMQGACVGRSWVVRGISRGATFVHDMAGMTARPSFLAVVLLAATLTACGGAASSPAAHRSPRAFDRRPPPARRRPARRRRREPPPADAGGPYAEALVALTADRCHPSRAGRAATTSARGGRRGDVVEGDRGPRPRDQARDSPRRRPGRQEHRDRRRHRLRPRQDESDWITLREKPSPARSTDCWTTSASSRPARPAPRRPRRRWRSSTTCRGHGPSVRAPRSARSLPRAATSRSRRTGRPSSPNSVSAKDPTQGAGAPRRLRTSNFGHR